MGIGFDLVYEIIKELKTLGKPYKMKASKSSLGLYQNDKTYLWGTCILPRDYPSRPYFYLEVSLFIKPLVFDEIDRTLRHAPNEKLGDAANSNIGRSFYDISKKNYAYDRDKLKNGEITAHMIAQTLLDDAMKEMKEFWEEVNSKNGDIFQFFVSRKEVEPMLAGLSYIHLKQYDKALECFEYAETSEKYWFLSFGNFRRYYHLIAADYCKVMINSLEWKAEYVVGGIEHLNL